MSEESITEKVTILDKLTDNIIAILMTIGVLYMTAASIVIPEWVVAIYGAIIAFYFKK